MDHVSPGRVLNGKWTLGAHVRAGFVDEAASVFEVSHRNGLGAAIEILPRELAADPERVARFLREAAEARWLERLGAVRPFDDDRTADGLVYVVYERLGRSGPGASLTKPLCDGIPSTRTAPWSPAIAMACLDENQLVAFFSPDRPPSLAVAVETHTASCKACREMLARYAEMSTESGTGLTQSDEPARALEKENTVAAPSLTPAGPADGALRLRGPIVGLIGSTVKGKWLVERLLGVGGMSYVFAARHRNGRRVALKCLRPELSTEPSFVERFLHEGYVANKIDHPGAVAILDDDIMDDGMPFLVMELLSGQSLRERLGEGILSVEEAFDVIAGVLDVLAVAHEQGIVHRDLKPDNLFLTEDGKVKVLDFGIARLKDRTTSARFETVTGTMIGTVGFMPPEQARGHAAEIDARSDVWAVGATLFALLTGRAVHEAATTNETLLLAMTSPVRPMAELLPELPIEAQALLDRALAFDRGARFQSAQEMKAAVEAARTVAAPTVIDRAPVEHAPAAAARTALMAPLPTAPLGTRPAGSTSTPAPPTALPASTSSVDSSSIVLPRAAPWRPFVIAGVVLASAAAVIALARGPRTKAELGSAQGAPPAAVVLERGPAEIPPAAAVSVAPRAEPTSEPPVASIAPVATASAPRVTTAPRSSGTKTGARAAAPPAASGADATPDPLAHRR